MERKLQELLNEISKTAFNIMELYKKLKEARK